MDEVSRNRFPTPSRSTATRSIADSPWFWAYLFTTAALVALALIGPKFAARQSQIEREFQGRQRAAQNLGGQTPSGELSSAERTLITLRPLFLGLAVVTTVAWIVFWRSRAKGSGFGVQRSGSNCEVRQVQ